MSDSSSEVNSSIYTRFITNYVVRFLFGAIIVYTCWIPFQNLGGWFSYHVILCTFGYIPLMAEGIMLFVGDDIWSQSLSRKAKYCIHGILLTVSTVVITIGNALVFHYIEPGYHLYTVHGITGLISMILIFISIVIGLAVNYPEQANKIASLRPVTYKLNHNVIGLVGYAIGVISLCTGFYTHWFKFYYGEDSILLVVILTVLVSIWPLNGALVSAYHQIKAVKT